MASLNKVFLIGNLTRDPELRTTQGGTQIAKFGLAINRRRTGPDGNQVEETCFVDITAFGRQAEVLHQYTKKGRLLFVEGRLNFSTWTAQDGGKRSKLDVVLEQFQFLDSRQGGRESASDAGGGMSGGFGEGPGFGNEPAEGEVPF